MLCQLYLSKPGESHIVKKNLTMWDNTDILLNKKDYKIIWSQNYKRAIYRTMGKRVKKIYIYLPKCQ